MKRCLRSLMVFSLLTITGCQGQLRLIIHNESGSELTLQSEGREYLLAVDGSATVDCPSDRLLVLSDGISRYAFMFPLGPRPHTINPYIEAHALVCNVRVISLNNMDILPIDQSETNKPISIPGQRISSAESRECPSNQMMRQ